MGMGIGWDGMGWEGGWMHGNEDVDGKEERG